jgi:hypothetical protein
MPPAPGIDEYGTQPRGQGPVPCHAYVDAVGRTCPQRCRSALPGVFTPGAVGNVIVVDGDRSPGGPGAGRRAADAYFDGAFTRAGGVFHTTPTRLNLGVDWAGALAAVPVVRSVIVCTCPSIGPAVAAAGRRDAVPFDTAVAAAAASPIVTMIAVRLRTRTFIDPPGQDRSTTYSAMKIGGVTPPRSTG